MSNELVGPAVVEVPNGGWDARVRQFRAGEEVDTTVVITRRYVVLVDTMTTPGMAATIADIIRPELAGRRLLVVNTHADWDHAWGNALFVDPDSPYHAPIIGHALTAARLREPETLAYLQERQAKEPRLAAVTLTPPTLTFTDRLEIDGGDLTLEMIPTPGHTPDHVAVWLPEIRLLLAGDAAEYPFPHIDNAADLPVLRASLHELAALDPATVIPCHGGVTTPDLIARNLAYFDEVARRAQVTLDATGMPSGPEQDMPERIGFAYADALAFTSADPAATPDFYRRFHQSAVRVTLEYLAEQQGHATGG
jgi:glyoxylase-like metal-dependent hydrolase (beta-lactamase superfamily II)